MIMKIVQTQALGLALDVSVPLVDLIYTVAAQVMFYFEKRALEDRFRTVA